MKGSRYVLKNGHYKVHFFIISIRKKGITNLSNFSLMNITLEKVMVVFSQIFWVFSYKKITKHYRIHIGRFKVKCGFFSFSCYEYSAFNIVITQLVCIRSVIQKKIMKYRKIPSCKPSLRFAYPHRFSSNITAAKRLKRIIILCSWQRTKVSLLEK